MTTREQIGEILDRDPDLLIGHPDDRGRVIDLWEATGMTPDEVEQWVEAGAFEPEAAVALRDAGVDPEQAATRTEAGHGDYAASVAFKVSNSDLSVEDATRIVSAAEEEHLDRIARGWLAGDYLLRQILPACLRALPVLDEHADRFAALPQVTSLTALYRAMWLVRETREALREHKRPPYDIGSVEDIIATLLAEAKDLELLDVTHSRYYRDCLNDPDEAIAADEAAERVEAILAGLSLVPILRAYMARPTTIG